MKHSVDDLIHAYGEVDNAPTRDQWRTLLDGDPDAPLTVVNFFKLRASADADLIGVAMSGNQAFEKYAETSVPKVSEVGGHFVLRGLFEGGFIGEELEDWHILAIGQYPRRKNFLQLLCDEEYREAFKYRQAAVEKQNVFFVNSI
ncbi:MAG: hypothetical protein B6D72_15490 [gamma proteobacterium symbiont of Ctena orbiculata]|uniref:DUF1330 domain-containing protein n=1 Tax=Candidatus Thiodiazotropha taylori TaxID=2792791 RepID=A0A944M462_9GAMM|nr:DUF1330 domain-containing protein [Candidatus Thiodiazotropha taylori]PVV08967.1 MAG: hypothetical protein B6D72_15490 [gamma proteobacterium symbiont of Ctena orbiculata]MBT2987701.1 DUF1330 domain-containing protein [Candidatus Thiodiazotropha taylori]MBT2995058.1 DUF1330 domain-containing protein [Candidatus Thiodiazotropha taylori]MBT3000023.1 DUF1330 domain-containing protein [Candidatus Thiodiazotropha taylori]